MDAILTIVWILMFVSQVWAAVIMFWWHREAPQRLRFSLWIFLILSFVAMVWMSMDM